MATKEEWKEFFELTEGRKPTIEEFTAAMKAGEISSDLTEVQSVPVSADKSNVTGDSAGKKKSKKWILALVGVLVILGIGGGMFGYVNYQQSQQINVTNIQKYLQSHGYTFIGKNQGENEVTVGNYTYSDEGNGFIVLALELLVRQP